MSVRKPFSLSGLLFIGALSTLLVSGCRLTPRSEGGAAQVRLINAVPDAGGLNISVDGQRVWKRSLFRSNTGYQSISSGNYPVRMDSASSGATLHGAGIGADAERRTPHRNRSAGGRAAGAG